MNLTRPLGVVVRFLSLKGKKAIIKLKLFFISPFLIPSVKPAVRAV